MKYLILLITALGAFNLLIAQTDQATINGKSYYVYPYQEEVEFTYKYFYAGVESKEEHQRDSKNRNVIGTEIVPLEDVVPLENLYNRDAKRKKTLPLLLRLRSEYPGVLMRFKFPLDKDITPTLEPLPDGVYVQYYRDLPYVDGKTLRFRNDVPCAFFHLKDNKLDGFACWLNPMGDTIKAGNFIAGLKEGDWYHRSYDYPMPTNLVNKKPLVFEKFVDHSYTDTTFFNVQFKNGLREGTCERGYNSFVREKGHFSNDEPAGEWFEYGIFYREVGEKLPPVREIVVDKHYFLPNKKQQPARSRIIRSEIIDRQRFEEKKEHLLGWFPDNLGSYYTLYLPENTVDTEEGLELPEEKNHSYPGEEYDRYYDYESEEDDLGYINFSYDRGGDTYYAKGKEYTRNGLIDSLGYISYYSTIYEEYHGNGKLCLRLTIDNGRIQEPDTIFWANGNPCNVLQQDPLTGNWKESVYDMNKVLLYVNDYDSLGTLTTKLTDEYEDEAIIINGKDYYFNDYSSFFTHHGGDSLYHAISTKQTLFEALWPRDSSTASVKTFDPQSRILEDKQFALNRDLVYHLNAEFSDDYSSVTAKEVCASGILRTETILSGSYQENPYRFFGYNDEYTRLMDSLRTMRVDGWKGNYDLTSDFTLFQNNQPFTGKFTLTGHMPEFNLEVTPNAIHLDYATGEKHQEALAKAHKKFWKRGKVTKEARFMSMPTYYREEISSLVWKVLPFADRLFEPVDDYHFFDGDEEYRYYEYEYDYEYNGKKPKKKKIKVLSEQEAEAFDKTVDGQFLNGKPEGVWTTFDQFGKPTTIMEFKNGQLNGKVAYYTTVYPPKKNTFDALMRYSPQQQLLNGPVPTEPTHYLARVVSYKNGFQDGPAYKLNWRGDTLEMAYYKEGRLEGDAYFRNPLVFTQGHFEGGVPDGIMRTYLTLPGKDSVLLSDLNYQNGTLQGESKSYHMSGKLAKRGFFLYGQPIDDFEAFDTLGFKYQYVKFLYNQPVEEKIWEENQLSVRYEFDWKDSIPFNTEAITETSGLERLMFELNGSRRSQPYYGRPSTVDKTGINYKMTKYYPNDSIARRGTITAGKKTGFWESWSYEGKKLYEVQYFDSIMAINDSVRFKSKGILTLLDSNGVAICKSFIVEKVEKYDCSHTDHHEVRMFRTFWERDSSMHRINGYVKNYYDNGVLMNEGNMKDGLATGIWKFYDPYGNLNMVGEYVLGKRNGRWLSGDLSQVKYMGDICLNPNLPNLDEILSYEEKLLDISVIYYRMTKVLNREYYGVNMNPDGPPEGYEGEEEYYFEGGEEFYYEED